MADRRTTTRERVELLANEVLAELYDWPIIVPSQLVYFARTASLIEGLGTHYDAHFNALAFATPIAVSLRGRIMASLYPEGARPQIDPMRAVGASIGAIARIVTRASRDMFDAVRDAIMISTMPPTDGGSPADGMPSTNGSAPTKRIRGE